MTPVGAEKAWADTFGTPFNWDLERCRWFAYGFTQRQAVK